MKLYCLSKDPAVPCLALRVKGVTVLLDCGLSLSAVLNFLPIPLVPNISFTDVQDWSPPPPHAGSLSNGAPTSRSMSSPVPPSPEGLKVKVGVSGKVFIHGCPEVELPNLSLIDVEEIDAVLVSNYNLLGALPYLVKQRGFRAKIYATEPTVQLGRLRLEEVLKFMEESVMCPTQEDWKQFPQLPSGLTPAKRVKWQKFYTKQDLIEALDKITYVGFNQKLDVFGGLDVTPVSAGVCVGSCNWLLQTCDEKIAYVSGSSHWTTHPRAIDIQRLKRPDIMILSALSRVQQHPDSMLGEFCWNVATTIRGGGSVLIPISPSGTNYDLFECLPGHLDNQNLGGIPMYYISPVAESSLAYSNIFAEWLCPAKQCKVEFPEEPFPHAKLVRDGRLKAYASVSDEGFNLEFRQPCVIFCGHPSLRFGPAVHFMHLWGSNPANAVIFTESEYTTQLSDILAPFQPVQMKVYQFPIDTALNYQQANKMLGDLKPAKIYLPKQYMSESSSTGDGSSAGMGVSSVTVPAASSSVTFDYNNILKIKRDRKFVLATLDRRLADRMDLEVEDENGVPMLHVDVAADIQDNRINLTINEDISKEELSRKPLLSQNGLSMDRFLQRLNKEGLKYIQLEDSGDEGKEISLPDENVLLKFTKNSTHIFIQDGPKADIVRRKIKNALLAALDPVPVMDVSSGLN